MKKIHLLRKKRFKYIKKISNKYMRHNKNIKFEKLYSIIFHYIFLMSYSSLLLDTFKCFNLIIHLILRKIHFLNHFNSIIVNNICSISKNSFFFFKNKYFSELFFSKFFLNNIVKVKYLSFLQTFCIFIYLLFFYFFIIFKILMFKKYYFYYKKYLQCNNDYYVFLSYRHWNNVFINSFYNSNLHYCKKNIFDLFEFLNNTTTRLTFSPNYNLFYLYFLKSYSNKYNYFLFYYLVSVFILWESVADFFSLYAAEELFVFGNYRKEIVTYHIW